MRYATTVHLQFNLRDVLLHPIFAWRSPPKKINAHVKTILLNSASQTSVFQNHLEGLLKQVPAPPTEPHPQRLMRAGPVTLPLQPPGPAEVVFLVLQPRWPWFNRPHRRLLLPGSVQTLYR